MLAETARFNQQFFNKVACCEIGGLLLFKVGKLEYIEYTNRISQQVSELMSEMYEAIMDRDDEEVVRLCDEMLEILHTIKEYHTDETLL